MKRMTKYVVLDVHQATTSASVREDGGRIIARAILPTAAPALVDFFRGMRGAIHVAASRNARAAVQRLTSSVSRAPRPARVSRWRLVEPAGLRF